MDHCHTQNEAFWSSKLKSILRIDFNHDSDYHHINIHDYSYESEYRDDVNARRHNRVLDAYIIIMEDTQVMLSQKLNECETIKQKLSHLISFIPIFEKFAKDVASVLTNKQSEFVHPNYGYQMDQFILLLKENQLKQDEDERKLIFEQINKVIPMNYDEDADEGCMWFGDVYDDEYNPEYIKSGTSGYLVSRFDVKSSTDLLNKLNDFILLNDAYLMEQFFITEKLECYLSSIQEYVSFLNESKLTVFGYGLLHEILQQFERMHNKSKHESVELEVAIDWLWAQYENSDDTKAKIQLIESLLQIEGIISKRCLSNIATAADPCIFMGVFDIVCEGITRRYEDEDRDLITGNLRSIFSENPNICLHILQDLCADSFSVDKLEHLCDITGFKFVCKVFDKGVEQRQKEHLKCVMLTKCYTLQYPDDFEPYLKYINMIKSNYFKFQIISEALKCIRNEIKNTSGSQPQHAIDLLVQCIAESYSDPLMQKLVIEMNESRQISEHFYNSLAAISFVSGAVHTAQKCDVLKDLCLSILKMCNTFWGDRKLTIEQNRQISMDMLTISKILIQPCCEDAT